MKTNHILAVLTFLLGILTVSGLHVPRHGDEDDDLHDLSHNNMAHDHSLPHSAPLIELNETMILLSHAPDPLSYWSHDFEAPEGQDFNNWRSLLILHVLGSVFASFILLPVAISMRSVRHSWQPAVTLIWFGILFFSSVTGSLYKKLTGNLYDGTTHGSMGYLILAFAGALAGVDALAFVYRAVAFFKGPLKTFGEFWSSVILNKSRTSEPEYATLVHEEPTEFYELDNERMESFSQNHHQDSSSGTLPNELRQWHHSDASEGTFVSATPTSVHRHTRNISAISTFSDDTLHNPIQHSRASSHEFEGSILPVRYRIGKFLLATAERVLVILGFVQLISGITVYSGICRGNYINGCLAHLIKGSIFFLYGLLSFGRYIGAWGDMGWAWNRLPADRAHKIPSAEAIESGVIFIYGITNVWMERFGAAPGSPFTTKEIQHISIAAMFAFAGFLGLALESSRARDWLSTRSASVVKSDERITPPPSYAGSFNPFPALVIGVTGVAMSAHHQAYLFQVQIHALWGYLLAGFGAFRILTYFFLWLRPPHSVLPSRPPTEAVASFFLTSGGLAFIFSTEQITFAAMRRGLDDMMFIFNVVVTLACIGCCWVLIIVTFKGFLHHRARMSPARYVSHKVLFNENAD